MLGELRADVWDAVAAFQVRSADSAVAAWMNARGTVPASPQDLEATGLVDRALFEGAGGRIRFEKLPQGVRLSVARRAGAALVLDRTLGDTP